MCLAIPGRILEIYREQGLRMGKLDFGGTVRKVLPGVHSQGRGRRLRAGARRLRHQHHRRRGGGPHLSAPRGNGRD